MQFKIYIAEFLVIPTWFRNVSFDLHPLVGGDGLLGLGWIVPVGVQVVRAGPQLGEVVGIEPVLARIAHGALQVGVEGGRRLGQPAVCVVTHLA